LGDVRRLGKIGLRTLVLTLCFSFSAVAIGILLVDTIKPGSGLPEEKRAELQQHYGKGAMKDDKNSQEAKVVESNLEKAKQAKSLSDTLLDMIPKNPLQEMVGALDGSSPGNGMLAVMFFALVFGIALASIPADRSATMIGWLEGLYDICMAIISFTMRLAPFCVACLVFAITARLGADILQSLFWFVTTVVLGLTLHLTVVYSIMLATVGGRNPLQFFRDVSEAMVTAFATSSSSATLPTALRVAHEDLKIPKELANFVMTVGATGNQNGTALYEGVVVLFLAQVFGVDLNLQQQITVVLMSVLAGIGTAGVPGGSLPLIVLVLQSVGVPGEGIGIILGIDRFLDMARTVLNVTGDLAIAACIARWEQRSPTGVPLRDEAHLFDGAGD
jgi:DAACS family dicarboxylate/amino acid:cation (Na+ or H+) symporter